MMFIEMLEPRRLMAQIIVVGDEPLTLHGTVFMDLDRSGDASDRWGGLDPGVYAARVYLDANDNGRRDKKEPTSLTDKDGRYSLRGFSKENYNATIRCVVPEGHVAMTPMAQVGYGSSFGIAAARLPRDASISTGVVLNAPSSALQPGQTRSNAMVTGVRVYIDLDRDGKRDKKEPQAITSGWGRIQFYNLHAGTYLLRMSTPGGFTTERDAIEVRVLNRQRRTQVFSLVGPREVRFTFYDDENANSRRDETERLVPGGPPVSIRMAAPLKLLVRAEEMMEPNGPWGAALPRIAATILYYQGDGEEQSIPLPADAVAIDLPLR